MKKEVVRQRKLPAFRITIGDFEALLNRIGTLFGGANCIARSP